MVASIAVTEPGAGSDVSALQTTAKKDGDSYVINGSKTYITNGTQADFLTLLARTSDDPGYHSFSLFIVPTELPGFQVSRKLNKMGCRSSDTAQLVLTEKRALTHPLASPGHRTRITTGSRAPLCQSLCRRCLCCPRSRDGNLL